jgi:AraC-like DNA-binding protein
MNKPDHEESGVNRDTLVTSLVPLPETSMDELSVVAVQLVEAARRARDGDREATRAHIAHAIALLRGQPSLGPSNTSAPTTLRPNLARGRLPAWQTRKVFAHVEANLSRRITIRELAQIVGLSASHFCRAFKNTFGLAPRDFVLRRRIDLAQALMLTTTDPLSSIAIRCGMCDQPHFTRSFHRIVGETPNKWRHTRQGALQSE